MAAALLRWPLHSRPPRSLYGMLLPNLRGEEGTPLTLAEVASTLADHLRCEVQHGDNPHQITVQGQGYHFVVSTFFGGWQATLYLPEKPPATFYTEAVEMLEKRLKAKLAGRNANF